VSSRSNASASSCGRAGVLLRRLAALLVLALAVGAGTGAAEAAPKKKKVAVLPFKGPKAARVQRGVVKLLRRQAKIVTKKAFIKAARKVEGYAPNAAGVSKVAQKLKLHGVVTGKVVKRKRKVRLTLKILEGRSGEPVGNGISVMLKGGKLNTAAKRKLRRELRAVLRELPDPGSADESSGLVARGEGGAGAAATAGAAGAAGTSGAAAPSGTGSTGTAGAAGTASPGTAGAAGSASAGTAGTASAGADPTATPSEPRPRQTRKSRPRPRRTRVASADVDAAGSGEPAGAVSRRAPQEPEQDRRSRGLDGIAGVSVVSRKLSFDFADGLQNTPQGYDGGLVPGVYAAAEIYPMALIDRKGRGIARDFGLDLMVDKVLVLKSKLEGGGDESLSTNQTRYGAGLVWRWNFGSSPTNPTIKLSARYNQLSFTIDESEAADPAAIEIPDVSYTFVDPGLELRVPIGERLAVLAEGRYVHVLDAGQIEDADRYGDASVFAFDADLGAELMVMPNLVARAGARFTQYSLEFDGQGALTERTDDGTQDVTAASDRYLGFYATAGVLF
jgi:TolB-like protein